jgi:hypothetical protein
MFWVGGHGFTLSATSAQRFYKLPRHHQNRIEGDHAAKGGGRWATPFTCQLQVLAALFLS